MSAGVELAKSFLRGELRACDLPFEDSQPFADLSLTYSERNASIEAAVMELAHGSCHDLTMALADALGLPAVTVIVNGAGMPIHSGLHHNDLGLFLDANGVHTLESALAFWGSIAGACHSVQMDIEDLSSISRCDDDASAVALEDFSLIAEFAQAEKLLKSNHPSCNTVEVQI